MKKLIVLVSVACIAAFSPLAFWSVAQMEHGGIHACPFSLFILGECSADRDALSVAQVHITSLEGLSSGVLAPAPVFFALFVFLAVFSGNAAHLIRPGVLSRFVYGCVAERIHRSFRRWLALRNKLLPDAVRSGGIRMHA